MTTPPPLDFAAELNPEQLAAVTHEEGPQLVLAGAGSGKTRVITFRIAWLVRERQVEPWRIAAVTFTNKAAREMEERVDTLLAGGTLVDGALVGGTKGLYVGTFHRFALRLLRRYGDRVALSSGFGVVDGSDQMQLVKRALEAEGLAETAFPPRAVLARISAAKSRLRSPERFEATAEDFFSRRVAPVYYRYQALLRDSATVDFDDLILLAVRLLRDDGDLGERLRSRLRHLLVDEFQDTNHAQLELVRSLVDGGGQLTAVGDEDQGIYRWRGAELSNILEFERSFPAATVRKLERNYRSTQTILDASGALVAHNEGRRGKRLWTDHGAGEPIELFRARDEVEEARWVVRTFRELHGQYRYREMAVLVRTNAQTRSVEDELLRHQIPYSLVAGVRFYDRAEIKDVVAYVRMVQHPRDNLSLLRILNRPPRGIGKATRDLLEEESTEVGRALWAVLKPDRSGRIPARGATALRRFRGLIEELQESAQRTPLPAFLSQVIEETGYGGLYRGEDSEATSRRENLNELLSAAQEFVEGSDQEDRPALGAEGGGALVDFLDHVALVSDVDFLDGEKGVSLMTLHSAKGLEFPVVVVAGLEDGLLPHFNAQGSRDEVEEERRLLYVGMTRARRRLALTTCRRRRIAGRYQDQSESPFLQEVPGDLLRVQESPTLFADERTNGVYRFFAQETEPPTIDVRQDEPTLQRGSRVRHATLGEGVVLDLDGGGDGAKITVVFDRAGKRRLVAKYAALELL